MTGKRQNIDMNIEEVENNDLLIEPNEQIEDLANDKEKSDILLN